VADAYARAQALENTGSRQYDQNDFDTAARTFTAAAAAYTAINDIPVAVDEPDPDPVATVDPNLAPADAARTAATTAKQGVREAMRTAEAYQTAERTEQAADRAYQGGQYAEALRLYGEAGRQFEAVNTLQSPEEQVNGALQILVRQFESGFSNEDLETLRGVNADYANANWGRFFEGASDVQATARPSLISVNGDQAEASVSIQLQYRDNRNRSQTGAFEHTWSLQRSGDRWVVTRVVVH
jgi:hypothetical protein